MAVAVEQRLLRGAGERQREPVGALTQQELLEEEALLRHRARVVRAHEPTLAGLALRDE